MGFEQGVAGCVADRGLRRATDCKTAQISRKLSCRLLFLLQAAPSGDAVALGFEAVGVLSG
jgi:hypothetical protein